MPSHNTIIPKYLRDLRKQMTGKQWIQLTKATIDAGVDYERIRTKYQREMKRYEC